MCYFMWLFLFKLLLFLLWAKNMSQVQICLTFLPQSRPAPRPNTTSPHHGPWLARPSCATALMCPYVYTLAHAPDLTPTAVPHCSPLLASSPLTHQLACAFIPLDKSHHSRPLPSAPTILANSHAPCCQSTILTPYDLPSQLKPTTPTCSIKFSF